MVDKYDPTFDDNGRGYGWAYNYVDDPNHKVIAEEVGIDHLIPYYKLSNKLIHSGSTSATYSMGTVQKHNEREDDSELAENYQVLAGPSNYGFTLPAQTTAISFAQVSTALIMLEPTRLRLIKLQALQELINDIGDSFFRAQQTIEKQEQVKR
jgi:hypothetical protein